MRPKNIRYKSPIFQAELAILKANGYTYVEMMEATGETIATLRGALKDMGLVKHRKEPQKKATPQERECDCCMEVNYIPFGRADCDECLELLDAEEKEDEKRDQKHTHACLKCKGEYDTRHDARGYPVHKLCFSCREVNKNMGTTRGRVI